ncbi:hypothetical protein SISNIDRAFT_547480 [Sistotremastrum niveocremeum HHB9708]|uniref:Uncharacterized protein n=1 Tax=Sistotremastrum niveocremeum HHB9708 TaxID=1314777 RepID=A0A164YA46_9AGAM|nr:hypothetical protein SISNIDRAFT_547480 [Sistotremastrum niveocremeum HHB9708]
MQYIEDLPFFWGGSSFMTRAELNKYNQILKASEAAKKNFIKSHVERVREKAGFQNIRGKQRKVITPVPQIVGQFTLLGKYRGTIFTTGLDTMFSVQFVDVDTNTPTLEGLHEPLPFQAFKSSSLTTGSTMWVPCWTEATHFEKGPGDMRKVYYTYDAYKRMMFMDRNTKECLVTMGMKHEVVEAPSFDDGSFDGPRNFMDEARLVMKEDDETSDTSRLLEQVAIS